MGYDAAGKGNQISTFCGNIVFLSPRVDGMSQDVVHVDHWKMNYVASKCYLITHWHGVISQKDRISTCVLHLPTGKPLPCLICGMPLCEDLHASLHETCEHNHKNHMLKLHPCGNSNTLKIIYFAYFHTVMEYGIIFWGVSVESKRIFQKQKRIIRIMTHSTSRISCRTWLWKL
jgi:hypothetical protein